MIYDCEQCNGTGWAKGQRCPCREEEDRAAVQRRYLHVVGGNMAEQKRSPKTIIKKVAKAAAPLAKAAAVVTVQKVVSKHLK